MIHAVKGSSIVNVAEVDVFLDSLTSSVIHQMLAIWSLLPLPFLNPSCILQVLHSPTAEASVQFSHWVVCDSLQPHESQHVRPPCPSPSPGVHSNSRPSSRWCHAPISSSVVPFSSYPNPSQHQSLFQWVNSSHVICISEVIDISLGNLDSSLGFLQPSVSNDVLCIKVKKAGW